MSAPSPILKPTLQSDSAPPPGKTEGVCMALAGLGCDTVVAVTHSSTVVGSARVSLDHVMLRLLPYRLKPAPVLITNSVATRRQANPSLLL